MATGGKAYDWSKGQPNAKERARICRDIDAKTLARLAGSPLPDISAGDLARFDSHRSALAEHMAQVLAVSLLRADIVEGAQAEKDILFGCRGRADGREGALARKPAQADNYEEG